MRLIAWQIDFMFKEDGWEGDKALICHAKCAFF